MLTVFTVREVEPFEELSFSYMGHIDDDSVRHLLQLGILDLDLTVKSSSLPAQKSATMPSLRLAIVGAQIV